MPMPDDFNPNASPPIEKCCPTCGFDPDEQNRLERTLIEATYCCCLYESCLAVLSKLMMKLDPKHPDPLAWARRILSAIIESDERGQGVQFTEAMNEARIFLASKFDEDM